MLIDDDYTIDELTDRWMDATAHHCCSCHISAPCGFCVDGYSLSLEEFLGVHGYDPAEQDPTETATEAYDRAMKSII